MEDSFWSLERSQGANPLRKFPAGVNEKETRRSTMNVWLLATVASGSNNRAEGKHLQIVLYLYAASMVCAVYFVLPVAFTNIINLKVNAIGYAAKWRVILTPRLRKAM